MSGVGPYVFEVPLADALVLDDGESVKDVSSMRRLNGKRPTTTSISEAHASSHSRRLYGELDFLQSVRQSLIFSRLKTGAHEVFQASVMGAGPMAVAIG